MATVIDALLVTLGLDASGYKSGTADVERQQSKLSKLMQKDAKERTALDKKAEHAQKKRADAFEKQGKHAAETFGKIRDHALGLIAVLAGGVGMVEFGKDMITGAANVKRLADNLGMPSKNVQAWQSSLKTVGGSAQSASNMLLTMSDSLTAFHSAGVVTSQMSAMQKFGINPGATNNAAVGLLRVSKYLSDIYKIHPNEAREHAAEMGIDESQFNLLKHYYALKKKLAYYEIHPVYTQAQEQQAEMMQVKLVQFGNSVKRVATDIAYQFLPVFQKLLDKFQVWANWAMSHQTQIVGWVDAFVDGLVKLGAEVNKAVQFLGGWKDVLIGLAAVKVLSMVSPLLSLAGALGKVGGSLAGISEASDGMMILKALGKAGLLGAAGVAGYEVGKHVVNPALNAGVKWASGGADTSFGQWLFKSTHEDPNYYKNLRKEHDNLIPISHNNPGDLRQWGNNPVKNGFAQFSSPAAGLTAMAENLKAYQRQGKDTVAKIINTWAPASDGNNTQAYINLTAQRLGVKPNQKINLNDPKTLALLMAAISAQETGGNYYSPSTIKSVAEVVARGRGGLVSVPRVNAATTAPARAAIVNHNTHSNEAHIGSVVVNTTAQDPRAHGRLVSNAIHRYLFTDALDSGII